MAFFDSWKRWAREQKIFIPMPYLGMTEIRCLDLRISSLPIQASCFESSLAEKRTFNCPALLSDKDDTVDTSSELAADVWFWFGLKPEKDCSTEKDLQGSLLVDPNYQCWLITHPTNNRFIVLPPKQVVLYQTGSPAKQPEMYIQVFMHWPDTIVCGMLGADKAQAKVKPPHVASKIIDRVVTGGEAPSTQQDKVKSICDKVVEVQNIGVLNAEMCSADIAPEVKEMESPFKVEEDEQTTNNLHTLKSTLVIEKDVNLPFIFPLTSEVHPENEVKYSSLPPTKPLQSKLNQQNQPSTAQSQSSIHLMAKQQTQVQGCDIVVPAPPFKCNKPLRQNTSPSQTKPEIKSDHVIPVLRRHVSHNDPGTVVEKNDTMASGKLLEHHSLKKLNLSKEKRGVSSSRHATKEADSSTNHSVKLTTSSSVGAAKNTKKKKRKRCCICCVQ